MKKLIVEGFIIEEENTLSDICPNYTNPSNCESGYRECNGTYTCGWD